MPEPETKARGAAVREREGRRAGDVDRLVERDLDVDDVAGLVGAVGVRSGDPGHGRRRRVDRDRGVGVEAAGASRRSKRQRRVVRRSVTDRPSARASEPVPVYASGEAVSPDCTV